MQQPCNSLDGCRREIDKLDRLLEKTASHTFTVQLLESWQGVVLSAIEVLRKQAITGQNVVSKDAVRNYMHNARDDLSLAIYTLDKKGVNRQYLNSMKSCQSNLEQALRFW